MTGAERKAVAGLWESHRSRDFSVACRGMEVDGVDLVLLDADLAGCVETWLGSSRDLDADRLRLLRERRDELERVLPVLDDAAGSAYFESLRHVVVLTASAQRGRA